MTENEKAQRRRKPLRLETFRMVKNVSTISQVRINRNSEARPTRELLEDIGTSLEAILGRLERVRPTGPGRWIARCPAHEDRSPSLSIAEGRDGRVLLHCWSACRTEAVLEVLGLTWSDLFPRRAGAGAWRPDPATARRERIRRGLAMWARELGRQLRDEYRHRNALKSYALDWLDPDFPNA